MDRSMYNEWAAALRGLADEMETVGGIARERVVVVEYADAPKPDVPQVVAEEVKLTSDDYFRQTYNELPGSDRTAMMRMLKRTFDHNAGPVRICKADGTDVIVRNMEEVTNAFGG